MNQAPFFNFPNPIFDINKIFKSIEELDNQINKIEQRLSKLEEMIDTPIENIKPKKINDISDYNKNYSNGHYII